MVKRKRTIGGPRRKSTRQTKKRTKWTSRSYTPAPKPKKRKASKPRYAAQHHAYMKSPFSKNASKQPKIPDGAFTTSMGRAFETIAEIQNAVGNETIDIVLFPGFGIGAAIQNTTAAATMDGVQPIALDHSTNWLGSADTSKSVDNESEIARWRLVAQSLQLLLVNSAEENNGWYETCRFTPAQFMADYVVRNTDGNNIENLTNAALCPHNKFFTDHITDMVMTNQRGYCLGKLTDLGKKEFLLHNISPKDDGIINMQETYNNSFANGTYDAINKLHSWTPDHDAQIMMRLLDQGTSLNSHDMILIRLHCRSNTGTSPNTGSKFVLRLGAGHEVEYTPKSPLHTFMTESPTVTGTNKLKDDANNKPDAVTSAPFTLGGG
ncbi:MAG: hypothetical protein QKB72_gp4 [Bacilladnaviridae sp.]|uniref:Capsid protein n=1 Tax=Bacilladnaviridae sp. isolate ctdc18 TaxID=3070177 RepID=A0A345MP94_9VIRU|nr:MAG: hypothetical protein QKB72_gp4 [Bacilladnaviridae sp.]AXH73194.1 MAG: hypothetical protein [Bacilladnaviridae sp. isolate ctdc18]